MNAIPVWKERALFIEELRALVIADVHIGIEFEYNLQGVNIGIQTDSLVNKCRMLLEAHDAEKLIIVGDLKHIIMARDKEQKTLMMREQREVRNFLRTLHDVAEIIIIKGNHDGALTTKYAEVHGARGLALGNISFVHGHCWAHERIMKGNILILGHIHPFVRMTAAVGYTSIHACWVRGKFRRKEFIEKYGNGNKNMEFVIMPAFNPLCGGVAVNREHIGGALFSLADMEHASVYTLEGINLGTIRNLR